MPRVQARNRRRSRAHVLMHHSCFDDARMSCIACTCCAVCVDSAGAVTSDGASRRIISRKRRKSVSKSKANLMD